MIQGHGNLFVCLVTSLVICPVQYRVVIRLVLVYNLYSISIIHGAAVIDENCSVHLPMLYVFVNILLNIACYLAKINK